MSKTNPVHVRTAIHVFTPKAFDQVDARIMSLRFLSFTEGDGPLPIDELKAKFEEDRAPIVTHWVRNLIEEGLVEWRNINGKECAALTKYFEDLIFWQKVKAGLIERPTA